jgi:hypothetical protein
VRDSVATATAATLAVSSNVYYLPAPAPVAESTPALSRWANLSRTWWRLRFALAGIRLALKPAPTPLFAEDETLAMLEGRAEIVERRRRQTQPARVIDFDAARARLRPAVATQ